MKRILFLTIFLLTLVGCTWTIQDTPELRAYYAARVTPLPVPDLPTSEPCLDIKGNVNASGDRIYHMFGQANYNNTLIDKPGEAFFCTEAEAQEAGFRKALR